MKNYLSCPEILLPGPHWRVTSVTLRTVTDNIDNLVQIRTQLLYRGGAEDTCGQIFFFENLQTGRAQVLLCSAADFETPTLTVNNGKASLNPNDFPVTVAECENGACEETVRAILREKRGGKQLYAISNTWGDGHRWDCVSDAFIRREIDSAAALGLDAVQIDDGWQTGSTADKTICDENGRRVFADPFWEVNRERFPEDLESVCRYAKEKNVGVGLWFAPDFHGHFAKMDRDIRVLSRAAALGCAYFKLDMLFVLDREDKARMLEYLNRLKAVGEVQLDVTNGVRLGYIAGGEHGTVFVENRYMNHPVRYYPYRTLRNLWMLSRFVPSQRLQTELVNPDLYPESFAPDDVFQAKNFTMDYLFAIAAMANPLFWMEVQFLSESRARELARILPVWKSIRDDLANADVMPLGSEPDGCSFTGFFATGKENYLLLFREKTGKNEIAFSLPQTFRQFTVIATNFGGTVTPIPGGVKVTFNEDNTYLLVKAEA